MSEITNALTPSAIEQFVTDQITSMGVDPADITPEATLVAMGLDSLDVVELSQAVKKNLRVQITPKDFEHASTLAEAVAVVLQHADAS